MEYDKSADTLYMRVGKSCPATSIDLNREIWARIDPTTGNVVGFEIEGFREVFLVKHPEMPRPSTKAVQPPIENEGWLTAFFAFLRKTGGLDGNDPPNVHVLRL